MSGDRVQLQQVVLNLLLNGLDAMRDSGDGERTLVLRTVRGGPRRAWWWRCRTRGSGIDEADLDHVFHAVLHHEDRGTGHGTGDRALHRRGARRPRWRPRNNPEGGATFSFTLPAIEDGP